MSEKECIQNLMLSGRLRVEKNYVHFNQLLNSIIQMIAKNHYSMAAVYSRIAASHACSGHCGIFASPALERCLLEISSHVLDREIISERQQIKEGQERVLHIAGEVRPIGGLTKMLQRWMVQDSRRVHSLALTHQGVQPIPEFLRRAVRQANGRIHFIDSVIGDLIARARLLRKLSRSADYIVLHIGPHDVVPILALSQKQGSPPVIYLNHGDHHFWLGISVSDVVANLRRSGAQLSWRRRGVASNRNMLLPTLLEPKERSMSRSEAKLHLGISNDDIVLISIARGIKYRNVNGITYADWHKPILMKYPNTKLIVIGPGPQPRWMENNRETKDRLQVYEELNEVEVYLQAADIYVDSFPFVSITSLLEAGRYELPLVSRYPYADDSSILGADMPGLDGTMILARDHEEYINVLSNLVEDPALRQRLGEACRRRIIEEHTGSNWQASLEAVYSRARSLPPLQQGCLGGERRSTDPPDVFIQNVFYGHYDLTRGAAQFIRDELGVMPLPERLKHWRVLHGNDLLGEPGRWGPYVHLLPQWLRVGAGRFRRAQPKMRSQNCADMACLG